MKLNHRLCALLFPLSLSAVAVVVQGDRHSYSLPKCSTMQAAAQQLDKYNVVCTSTSKFSSGSMPLGNGDIGLNVWVEESGDLLFYISKTDAWNENARLLKLGRVRVKLTPNPFTPGTRFVQTLRLREGEIEIRGGVGSSRVDLRIWVDANQPVVRVETASKRRFDMQVKLEVWRDKPRVLSGEELQSAWLDGGSEPVVETPDKVLPPQDDRLVWFHRNLSSAWQTTLKHQGMGAWMSQAADPIQNRTFGGGMQGDCLKSSDRMTLRSVVPANHCTLSIYLLTQQTATEQEWVERLDRLISSIEARSLESQYVAHQEWWEAFWERSWIWVSGASDAETVTRGYVLQRFISAIGGRGAYPIKFNGSIFTVDTREMSKPFDADFRKWGGPYWFQNTRLIYWPMLAAGDFEMMQPLFRMYRNALPFAEERTRRYFKHEGAFFPETMYFWGAYANKDYGWNREGKTVSYVENPYMRWYYSGGLELIALMLDYYRYTGDEQFAHHTLLPVADKIVQFYDKHYPRDRRGRILFKPAQSLETWHEVVNPLPEVAGLNFVLDGLLELKPVLVGESRQSEWRRLRAELPPIPQGEKAGQKVLLPAEQVFGSVVNVENPELYAIFPYRVFGVGKPELETAVQTFSQRRNKANDGWRQDDIQAAFLGLADEARKGLVQRFDNKHDGSSFPAFWGPNFDWIPDQTHGTAGMKALQSMLLQVDGKRLLLFPAWPEDWDVEFRLRAPMNTIVEGVFRNGEVEQLKVTPASRRNDVVLMR